MRYLIKQDDKADQVHHFLSELLTQVLYSKSIDQFEDGDQFVQDLYMSLEYNLYLILDELRYVLDTLGPDTIISPHHL